MLIYLLAVFSVTAKEFGNHSRVVRDSGYSQYASADPIQGAITKLEQQFHYLLTYTMRLIDPAIEAVVSDCEESSLQTRSFGAALIGGGVGDTLADYYGNSRSPEDILTMPDVQYSYGYNLGYGVGFAAPFLLPTYVPSCSVDCSSSDFLQVARKYGLSYGLTGKYLGEAEICSFGIDAKQSLNCLLTNAGDSKEAARVEYLIDDMVEAALQRGKLQKIGGYV